MQVDVWPSKFISPSEEGAGFRFVVATKMSPYPGVVFKRFRPGFLGVEYILKGEGYLKIGEDVWHPKANDAFLLHKNIHQEYSTGYHNSWEKVFLLFYGRLVDEVVATYGLDQFHFLPSSTYLKPYFDKFLAIWKDKRDDFQDQAAIEFLKLAIRIKDEEMKESSQYSEMVMSVMDIIERNLEEKFDMSTLSEELFLSIGHITRLFKDEVGVSPYDYMISRKIAHAKDLLEATDMPVKEVAFRLKYSDQYYFSSAFKRVVGVSPMNYRKNMNV